MYAGVYIVFGGDRMDFLGKIKDVKMPTENGVEITISTDNTTIVKSLEQELLRQKDLNISIKRNYNKRSLDANAYFHLLVNKLARYFNIPDEEMKIKMNLQYGTLARDKNNKIIGVKIPVSADITEFYPYAKLIGTCTENGKDFNKYLFYKETHLLNTKEMSDLIEGVVQECREYGIPTKTEDEIKKMVNSWDSKQEGENLC